MKQEKIIDALEHLDDALLLETNQRRQKKGKRIRWLRWGASAACLCLLLTGLFLARDGRVPANDRLPENVLDTPEGVKPESDKGLRDDGIRPENESVTETSTIPETNAIQEGITIDPMEVDLKREEGVSADMMAFFIYGGRVYAEYQRIEDADGTLAGDYVATAIGLIDEWTEDDGYVELAGSVSGDFYTVNGYDPDFILCMKQENEGENTLLLFFNITDITLNLGADLYTDCLRLDKTYETITYETRQSWNYHYGQVKALPETARGTVERFLDALNTGRFMHLSDIPLEEGKGTVYDARELYHMYFHMADGMVIHLRLLDGGYVIFPGLWQACVAVDEGVFEELIQILSKS